MSTTVMNNNNDLLQAVDAEMDDIYPNYDSSVMKEIGRTYIECIDKEGFIFDLDQAWKWAGYAKKGSAKRVLIRDLRIDVDYKILKIGDENFIDPNMAKPPSNLLLLQTNKRLPIQKNPRSNKGGQNIERILLTSRAFRVFMLNAPGEHGKEFKELFVNIDDLMVKVITKDHQIRGVYNQLVNTTFNKIKDCKKSDSVHNRIRDELARKENGTAEYSNVAGRCDVVTAKFAIEVKETRRWAGAMGQALAYAAATNKRPRIHLFGSEPPDICKRVCQGLGVTISFTKI
jgi:hypothetical protein